MSNEPIERGLPSNDAKNQFLREPAIDRCERGFRQRFFEQILDEAATVIMAAKDAGGNFSWFFGTHCLIMSFAQLEGASARAQFSGTLTSEQQV